MNKKALNLPCVNSNVLVKNCALPEKSWTVNTTCKNEVKRLYQLALHQEKFRRPYQTVFRWYEFLNAALNVIVA